MWSDSSAQWISRSPVAARPHSAPWHHPGCTSQHGGHETLFQLVYPSKLFLSFLKDSHITDACWGWLQPGITPRLYLGITWEMPVGPCRGPSNSRDTLVLLWEPTLRTCIIYQSRCS